MKVDHLMPNQRLQDLKAAWLEVTPSISIDRAIAFTEVARQTWDLPANLRIAKCFRRACETAPLLIQDNELIVGNPCGKPRAGALSPDIAWEWIADEIDEISTRPQDPYYISEEDKKTMLEEIFPFWKGKSLAEACEVEMRKAGYWDYGMEAAITDLSYHVTPDGRPAFAPLSDGMSPSQGADRNGPTAVVKSASKLHCENMNLGMSHNFKFSPQFIDNPQGRMGVNTLLKGAAYLGNAQMQFNCVSNTELRDAKIHPEKHKDLIVRVAGYSAFFTELCDEVQDEIIARTEIDEC